VLRSNRDFLTSDVADGEVLNISTDIIKLVQSIASSAAYGGYRETPTFSAGPCCPDRAKGPNPIGRLGDRCAPASSTRNTNNRYTTGRVERSMRLARTIGNLGFRYGSERLENLTRVPLSCLRRSVWWGRKTFLSEPRPSNPALLVSIPKATLIESPAGFARRRALTPRCTRCRRGVSAYRTCRRCRAVRCR